MKINTTKEFINNFIQLIAPEEAKEVLGLLQNFVTPKVTKISASE